MSLDVVTAQWTGFPGGPGTSTFYMDDATTWNMTPLHDFFGVLLGIMPTSVMINMPTAGAKIDPTNGELVGAWVRAATTPMPGSNANDYASGVGASVRWETGDIAHGHRVRGRTYLIPLVQSVFDTNGSLEESQLTLIKNAATATIAAYPAVMQVWHRPKTTGVTRPGSAHAVTSAAVPDRCAILRSRRG